MNKKNCIVKTVMLFACVILCILLFPEKKTEAAELTGEDISSLYFSFSSYTYYVRENDIITISTDTNIPTENVSIDYLFSNGCAAFDSYTENSNEIKVRGVTYGTDVITAQVKITYYNTDGTAAEYVLTAYADIYVQQASEYISENNVYRAAGSAPYGLSLVNFAEGTLEWTSSNTLVATVDANGTVTPVAAGQCDITVVLTRPSGTKNSYVCTFHVTNPVLSITSSNLAKDNNMSITVSGTAGSAEWFSSDSSVAAVYSNTYENEAPGAVISAYSTGKAVISVNVDGITLTCTITVTNPRIKKDFYVVVKGVTKNVNLKGTNAASKVSYSTTNSRVATVNKNGVIKTKGIGYAAIVIKVDGAELTVSMNVGKEKAVKAIQNALKVEGATYSQARRMQKGYYDCSSLVWRSYVPVGVRFGVRGYAPVAANEAKYLVGHKKTLPAKAIRKLNKLRPGDLLFFKGKSNGRYKNIYHVAIYMGQQGESYDGKVYTYGRIVHASSSAGKVAQSDIYNTDNIAVIGRPIK